MTTNLVRSVFTLLTLTTLLAACGYEEQRESRAQLSQAAQAMEGNPQQALGLLRAVQGGVLSEADYAYYVLLQARVAGMNGTNIAPMERAVGEAKDYFIGRKNAPRAAFGCFVLAKVHEAQGNSTNALYFYSQADKWAEKASYQVPNFIYSIIPYNIASWCYRKGEYEESLQYLEKALAHVETEGCSYVRKLYMLELKALNFRTLGEVDNALHYYGEALRIAEQNSDILSKNRILYNQYSMLYNIKEYMLAEKKCKELLPLLIKSNDSLHIGLTHLALANIYANTDRVDSASVSIHQANNLLKDVKNNDMRLSLYRTLSSIEQKKGNLSKASAYQRQYNEYKEQLENKRKAEEAELQVMATKSRQEGELLAASLAYTDIDRISFAEHRRQGWLVVGMLVVCIGGGYGVVLFRSWLRSMASEQDPVPEFCRDELLRYAGRQNALRHLFEKTRHCRDNDQVGRIAYMVDELIPPDDWSWLRMSPSLRCSYAELLCKLRNDLPQLSEQELRLCMLYYAHRLTAQELASVLSLEPEEVTALKKSVRRKVRAAGYTSRELRERIKRYV